MTNEELRRFIANVEERNPGKFRFGVPPLEGELMMFFDYDRSGRWDGEWDQNLSLWMREGEALENFHQRFWNTVFPNPLVLKSPK